MKEHFTEADLLETYYMQPGQSMPIMMHLASCSDCAARYERLERKIREAAACPNEKPEDFWSRQRTSILHRVRTASPRRFLKAPALRAAAAVLLVIGLAGVAVQRSRTPEQPALTATVTSPAPPQSDYQSLPSDPWKSDELQEFGSVVDWESWIDETKATNGDRPS